MTDETPKSPGGWGEATEKKSTSQPAQMQL